MHESIANAPGLDQHGLARSAASVDDLNMAGLMSLSGGCAHHLNNILTTITTAGRLALDDVDEDTEAAECLRLLLDEADRAAQLVESLMLFAQEEGEARKTENFGKLLDDIVAGIRQAMPEGIEVDFSRPDRGAMVFGDARQMRRMVEAIVTNAREAMPEGGKISVALKLEEATRKRLPEGLPPGWYAILRISDTGSGMPPEVADQIFHPFFTTKSPGSGTGLSLSEVYGIVRSHRGEVTVESTPGTGTEMTIWLPLVEPPRQERSSLGRCEGGTEKLLLVEDDPGVMKVMEIALSRLGYDVVTAENGKEALEAYEKQHGTIALVLADLMMPVMDGMELCNELEKQYPEAKILLVSGSVSESTMERIDNPNVVGFLHKPIGPSELADAVRGVLAA